MTITKSFETGQTVTVWPVLGVGESRDTEPGAQPRRAEFVGYTTDGRAIIRTADGGTYHHGCYRIIDAAALR